MGRTDSKGGGRRRATGDPGLGNREDLYHGWSEKEALESIAEAGVLRRLFKVQQARSPEL